MTAEELLKAQDEGRLLVLPCSPGDPVYIVVDECTFGDDCHTKMKCKECEYHEVSVESGPFNFRMLNTDGTLQEMYHLSREVAETIAEEMRG